MSKKTKELYENIYKDNFSFGKNREDFLTKLSDEKIENAKKYLIKFMWWEENIRWKTIIDFGSWSWLMSLGFYLLWAKKIVSVDIDEDSIYCTNVLKKKYYKEWHGEWEVIKWSILDKKFIHTLWKFDIAYSWWVIHHSWSMWEWLENMIGLTQDKWLLYIAIYNKAKILVEWTSHFWSKIKKIYSWTKLLRPIIKVIYTAYLILWLIIKWKNPFTYIKNYDKSDFRWMDFFVDIEDWLGWYPYEYASFEEIKEFYEKKWLKLTHSNKVRSIWCNEFLFKKI